jgi:GTPase SAR1 family protein
MKLTVLGKGMVGKSSITYRFINYQTPTDHDATLEDRYKVYQEIERIPYELGNIIIKNSSIFRNNGHSRPRRLSRNA